MATNDALLDAVATLSENCNAYLDCEDCPLHDPENVLECIFRNYLPYQIDSARLEKAVKR